MDYEAVLAQVLDLLQREKRLSYRVLKRRLGVDDDEPEDLKEDLIYAKKLAVDEEGRVLVWTGAATAEPPATLPGRAPDQAPLAYTPTYLTEKILASRAALEGERKQVTVLFADIKDSTELIRDLDPEAAQQLLDPAIHRMMEAVHRFEGTVNQVLGDGIMALFGAPIAHEDHSLRACYAAMAMQALLPRKCGALGGLSCASGLVSTPGNWLSTPLAMTRIWTTRPWARPRPWRHAWNNWPRRRRSA
jgi:class 3 adenylate cyclase